MKEKQDIFFESTGIPPEEEPGTKAVFNVLSSAAKDRQKQAWPRGEIGWKDLRFKLQRRETQAKEALTQRN